MAEIVETFLKPDGKRKKVWGNFRAEADRLVYESQVTEEFTVRDENSRPALKAMKAAIKNGTAKIDAANASKLEKALAEKEISYTRITYMKAVTDVIAIRTKENLVVGNSSILPNIGAYSSYGNRQANNLQTTIQRLLESKVTMVPFTVFDQAKLDVTAFKIVEAGRPEQVTRLVRSGRYDKEHKEIMTTANVHFTGASLFEVDGKYFLFDIDRREVAHKIFNPFLVQLTGKYKTIKEAYQSLKPKLVVDAEKKGQKVLRQGEWFFVPTKKPKIPKLSAKEKMLLLVGIDSWRAKSPVVTANMSKAEITKLYKEAEILLDRVPKQVSLQAGQNRPNNAQVGLKVGRHFVVTGKVRHSGREHADLVLKNWYIAIPNTSIASFTITGDID
jgi:hypothetical protein